MNIDPLTFKLIGWLIGFLFTSLIGIIIWISKSVMKKIDIIVNNQETDVIDRTTMRKDIDTIKSDLGSIKSELKDISDIKQKLIRIETNEMHLVNDISLFKSSILDSQKKLSSLSEKIIIQEQLIKSLQNGKDTSTD